MALDPVLEVSELFYSIQGESSYSGYPCVFIRLAGCNLRCSYCDTSYSYDEESRQIPISAILEYVEKFPDSLVEITGGEPLLQENVYLLMDKLLGYRYRVLIETNGSISLNRIPDKVCVIVDVKCPGSGAGDSFLLENLQIIKNRLQNDLGSTEVKFVITDRFDYQWAKQFIHQHDLKRNVPITFSPVLSEIDPAQLGEMILTDRLPVRLQLQLHTILWPEERRGV